MDIVVLLVDGAVDGLQGILGDVLGKCTVDGSVNSEREMSGLSYFPAELFPLCLVDNLLWYVRLF